MKHNISKLMGLSKVNLTHLFIPISAYIKRKISSNLPLYLRELKRINSKTVNKKDQNIH